MDIKTIINDIFTARDGKSISMTKLFAMMGAGALIYNFIITASQDYNGFGFALAALIASMAAKYYVEDRYNGDT